VGESMLAAGHSKNITASTTHSLRRHKVLHVMHKTSELYNKKNLLNSQIHKKLQNVELSQSELQRL